MRKITYSILTVICLLIICSSAICRQELKIEKSSTPQKKPEPLIIEDPNWKPHGVFNGSIVINGEGVQESGYEGLMYIDMDGDKIRISCTEAVRSRCGELF